jgi:hypothetical protein
MKRLLPVVAAFAAGFLATEVVAQAEKFIFGVLPSHRVTESFDMSVGISAGGRELRAREVVQVRERLNQPAHYGDVIAVTGDAESAVLWYRDKSGIVRNAIVEKPSGVLYLVAPTTSEKLEVEEHR